MKSYYRGSEVTLTGLSRMDGDDEIVEVRFVRNGKAYWVLEALLESKATPRPPHAPGARRD